VARLIETSDAKWIKTRVDAYAGQGGEDEPRSFDVGHQRLDVLEVVERWRVSADRYFKVKVRNRELYILRQHSAGEDWEMASLKLHR
jgi:hypothetical protein